MVAHPDQTGVTKGSLRFVMSVRAIGEGHRSSIEFRTGTVDDHGKVTIEVAPPFATRGATEAVPLDAVVFRSELRRLRSDGESADYVLDALGEQFTVTALEKRLTRLQARLATRRQDGSIISLMRRIAERTYGISFSADTSLDERVLLPAAAAERNGMEDARFVRFEHRDGTVSYFATYTAYDGVDIAQQLLETTDFRVFTSSPIVNLAANKSLALFPRRIGGRFAALSRSDHETMRGKKIMSKVAGDEGLHHAFYRDLVLAALEIDPSSMVMAIHSELRNFKMPGTGIPGFTKHEEAIALAGIFGAQQFVEAVVKPTLSHWRIFDLEGLSAEADQAREKMVRNLAGLTRLAAAQQARIAALQA